MQTDSLFYRLFQTAPTLLFELLGQGSHPPASYVFRSVELKQTAFRIDGIFLPKVVTAETPVYLVEVQFQPDPQLYSRVFCEGMIFLRQNPAVKHWRVVMIFGDRSCEPKDPDAYASLLDLPEVHRLYLNELAEQASESVELQLMRLIVAPQESAIRQAQTLVAQAREMPSRLSPSEIIDIIETILVYKFPKLSWQEIEAMFGLSELKQTRVYQQGHEEGREEGREDEAQLLILRLLTRRLGELPRLVREQVVQLPLASLEDLGEALLEFSGIEDLQRWLAAHSPQEGSQ
ncbi:MAG: Rpn family recombination-promoting nuclease/putative transposase [Cyanobacteria bacterium J06636_16]